MQLYVENALRNTKYETSHVKCKPILFLVFEGMAFDKKFIHMLVG